MVKTKGFGKKRSGLTEVLPLNLPGGTKENHGNLRPRFEALTISERDSAALLRW
jgi:hypothetical protein